jgi:hypothetical protein
MAAHLVEWEVLIPERFIRTYFAVSNAYMQSISEDPDLPHDLIVSIETRAVYS